MHNIILIATGHKEGGICNSDELLKIIKRIAPDIIFEEVPPHKFEGVYNGTVTDSLETMTIKRYLDDHPIAHFPVDRDIDQNIVKDFIIDLRKMHNTFGYHSDEYKYLSAQHSYRTEQDGFPYLNSGLCIEILEQRIFLEKEIVTYIDHEELSLKYKDWSEHNDSREYEMIENIYKYSSLHKYGSALFLVGAEHKKPIMDKLPNLEKNDNPELNWIFDYFK